MRAEKDPLWANRYRMAGDLMAPKFFPVSPAVWGLVRRQGHQVTLVYLYVLSNPHRSGEGLYRLPITYAAADLDMSAQDVCDAFEKLQRERLIDYDSDTEVMLDRHALLTLPPKSKTQLDGAINKLREVPRTVLFLTFHMLARAYAPELEERLESDPLIGEYLNTSGEGIGNTSDDTRHIGESHRVRRLRDGSTVSRSEKGSLSW